MEEPRNKENLKIELFDDIITKSNYSDMDYNSLIPFNFKEEPYLENLKLKFPLFNKFIYQKDYLWNKNVYSFTKPSYFKNEIYMCIFTFVKYDNFYLSKIVFRNGINNTDYLNESIKFENIEDIYKSINECLIISTDINLIKPDEIINPLLN